MIKYFNLICVFTTLSICAFSSKISYDLGELTQIALKENPSIKASKLGLEQSRQGEFQVGQLPNPTFRYTYFGENVETKVGPQEQKFSLEQKIPWLSKLSNQKEHARVNILMADAEVHKSLTMTLLKVRLTWADIQYLNLTQKSKLKTLNLYHDWLEKLKVDFEVSKIPYSRILKMENQIFSLKEELESLERNLKNKYSLLKSILNLPQNQELKLEDSSPLLQLSQLQGMGLLNQAGHHNHKLMMSRNNSSFWKTKKALDQSEFYPDLSIGLSYIQTGDSNTPGNIESGKDPWAIHLGMTIPIYFNQTKAKIREAQLGEQKAKMQLLSAKNHFQSTLIQLLNELRAAKAKQVLYETQILPNLAQSIQIQTTDLTSGKASFLELLSDYQMQLEFELKNNLSIQKQFKVKSKVLWLIGDTNPTFSFPFKTSFPQDNKL
jgi:outer membrane protein TolC